MKIILINLDGLGDISYRELMNKTPLEAANKATAHLFIVNPFKEKGHRAVDWFASLFNTHPPISKRIAALRKMA